jgi:hypothetical protein
MTQHPTPAAGGQHPAAATDPAGGPADAVGAVEAALLAAAKASPPDTADPTVSLTFALGWQMAELFRADLRHRSERRDGDLPGLGSLSDEERREISVDQVQAALTQLTPAIQKAGLTMPTNELNGVRIALGNWTAAGPPAVEALHLKLLGTLTAAAFRLGKAYGLGRALADTCRKPIDADGVKDELDPFRVANLLAWLDELSTALPPHGAHSVYTSLKQWRDWAVANKLPADATTTIKRQGELWRALLSGEKRGTEMLEIGNYLQAAGKVAGRMSSIFWRAVLHFWWLVLVVAALIAGAVLLFIKGGSGHIVAGAGTLLAAFGLSWKGVGGALGKLAGKLEQPLWGAVLDRAIADAITLKPGNKADVLGRAALASDLAVASKRARNASGSNDDVQAPDPSGP